MAALSAPAVTMTRSAGAVDPSVLPEEERARASCYRLLAALLTSPPTKTILSTLRAAPPEQQGLGACVTEISSLAAQLSLDQLEREYHALFIGMPRGELIPHASYYLTGFLHEKPLAKIRADLHRFGLQRDDSIAEPEDHIGHLCEVMSLLIDNPLHACDLDTQRKFFSAHIERWAGRFFSDLENAEAAWFYKPVGRLGRDFMMVEQQAFALAA